MNNGNSEYYKKRFELFPMFCPYIDLGHQLISKFSTASWANNPISPDYENAHIWVCQRLYSYHNSQNEIDDAELLKRLLDNHLSAIAEVIFADEKILIKEFPKMLN